MINKSARFLSTYARIVLFVPLTLMFACSGGESSTDPDPPAVASVTLDRTTASIEQGKTTTLVATLRDANGAVLTGRTIAWTSDAASVASVTTGVVTGAAVGTANITATSEGRSASAAITVTPIPVASVVLSSDEVTLDVGQNTTLTAETRAANGNLLTGRTINWASADVTKVTVQNGVVTAVAAGSTTISATSEGKSATATVTVNAPQSCASTVATGRLVSSPNEFRYVTLAGWTVVLTPGVLTITAPGTVSWAYEFWGGIHENVAGKHIKDLLGDRRTILLPGGVIITSRLQIPPNPGLPSMAWVQSISIYEGNETHRINLPTFSVVESCMLPMFGEAAEHDGETASIYLNNDGFRMENVYQQDATPAGVPLDKVFNTVPLAQTFFNNPNQVNDFFDDPRLAHTWE